MDSGISEFLCFNSRILAEILSPLQTCLDFSPIKTYTRYEEAFNVVYACPELFNTYFLYTSCRNSGTTEVRNSRLGPDFQPSLYSEFYSQQV